MPALFVLLLACLSVFVLAYVLCVRVCVCVTKYRKLIQLFCLCRDTVDAGVGVSVGVSVWGTRCGGVYVHMCDNCITDCGVVDGLLLAVDAASILFCKTHSS
jgi:hypothetical protein